jgi:hypothetical protein
VRLRMEQQGRPKKLSWPWLLCLRQKKILPLMPCLIIQELVGDDDERW